MVNQNTSELLVIGPGDLGARVATLWKEKFPEAQITLKANRNDPDRESKWQSLGYIPYISEEDGKFHKYQNVLFAAPPGSGDGRLYANEITNAVAKFTSPNGLFIFTSSGGVYTENSGGVVDEKSDVVQVRKYFVVMITAILPWHNIFFTSYHKDRATQLILSCLISYSLQLLPLKLVPILYFVYLNGCLPGGRKWVSH